MRLKVFNYWDSGVEGMPPLIRYIYDHNCNLAKRDNYDIILITKKNFKDYLKYIPNYFYNLEANYQADIVRFSCSKSIWWYLAGL